MKGLKKTACLVMSAAALAAGATGAEATLTAREASIVPIAAFTASGNEAALKGALEAGLKNGMTVNEIKALLEQMYAYTGFPRSLTGLGVFVNLLKERQSAGITDEKGREPSPLSEGKTIRELGTDTQTKLVGRPVAGPVYDFSPNIDTYLKEHLFGDIFANDLLNWRERELATVSALAALPAPAQLRSHLNVCLNVGIRPDELEAFTDILEKEVSPMTGELAKTTLKAVLDAKK